MEKQIFINDQPVFYRVSGKGRPVMLVHGFGEDGNIWENQVPVLEKKYLLIVPDLPGSGRSAPAKDVSMEAMAAVLKNILDDLRITACTMIGHSMGGYIVLAFAEKYPLYLHTIGLFHSSAYADDEEKKTARKRGIEFIRDHGAARFLEQAIPNLFSDTFKAQYPDTVKEIIARYTNFPAQSLVRYYEAMMQRPDRTHVLKEFPKAVLFIAGESDTSVPLEHSLQQCHLPGLSYIHILRNSGHMGMLEESAKSTQIVENFLLHDEIG